MAATLAACAKKPEQETTSALGGPVKPGTERDFAASAGDTVTFATDTVDLSAVAQATLRRQAAWLRRYRQHNILIEGHADERGTREYNLALGARRAVTVKAFLARQGVAAGRMRTISYGKERPIAVCNDISCWSQNRRAVTRLEPGASS